MDIRYCFFRSAVVFAEKVKAYLKPPCQFCESTTQSSIQKLHSCTQCVKVSNKNFKDSNKIGTIFCKNVHRNYLAWS